MNYWLMKSELDVQSIDQKVRFLADNSKKIMRVLMKILFQEKL